MNVDFIALNLDLVLGRCHCLCLGVLELFHDDDIVVIDAISYIDETVVGSRVIFVFCNRMVLIIYGIVNIPCLMTKRYNTPFCIRCARCVDHRGRGLIADGHAIGHRDRSLFAGGQTAGSLCTGTAAGNADGIVALHRRRDAANGDGILTDAGKGIFALIGRILVAICIGKVISLIIDGHLTCHIAGTTNDDGAIAKGFIAGTAADCGKITASLILCTAGNAGSLASSLVLPTAADAGIFSKGLVI